MKTKIICEVASCHNGSLRLAKAIIETASKNGADIVKFQDWRASNVPDNDSDKDRYERLEFKEEWYPEVIQCCKDNNIEFLTTCFNVNRIAFLAELGLKKIKLASISLTNTDLLMMAGASFDEVIVSTAMHSLDEVEEAIDILESNAQTYTIMHCVANYPLEVNYANMGRLDGINAILGDHGTIGYSDHCLNPEPAMIAIAKGVKYLEKHFTLSRYIPQEKHQMYEDGPYITTHQIAIEPHELKHLVRWRDDVMLMYQEPVNKIEEKIKERYFNRYGK